ncbi:MAG: glycine cleavage system protein T [Chloroflexi bacterium]|nr:glycine cleavage system protein T [Chloroflexota bacterium]HCU72494.1 glycine cleavage system aminomethyltransferase GcvT [Chloroflexota bacterium]
MPDHKTYADLVFNKSLDDVDPLIADLIEHEQRRQFSKLILIPSESITPAPVRMALGSPLTSLYGEGYPAGPMTRDTPERLADLDWQLARFRRYGDRRYYRGNEFTNVLESLAQRRCASLFANEWIKAEDLRVNVQALSGAAANNAVYEALLEPDDKILGLSLAHGGHLSHGAIVNRSGRRFQTASYTITDVNAQLDYTNILEIARQEQPRIIVAGYTSYPWAPDWDRFREIADEVNAYLLADISHPAGLVAAGEYPSPVGIADIVTFTTHKTLFGPRAAAILSHKHSVMRRVDRSVFPGEQGGPHLNKIGAMAVAFEIASTDAFRATQRQIVANAAVLAEALTKNNVGLAYGGTNTHLLVIDLKRSGAVGDLRGEPAVRMLDQIGIVANRNSLPGDIGFSAPTGVRIGTPWLTQRGFGPTEMKELAAILAQSFEAMTGVTFPGRRNDRFRGRIHFTKFRKLQKDVLALAEHGHAEHTHSSTDQKPSAVIELRGRRVLAFADEISDQQVRDMQPGDVVHVGISEPDSNVCSALLVRPKDNNLPWDRRLYVIVDPAASENMAAWFRSISDGYALLDNDEPSRKIVGPVVVTEATNTVGVVSAVILAESDANVFGKRSGTTSVQLGEHSALLVRDGAAAALLYDQDNAIAFTTMLENRVITSGSLPEPPDPDLNQPFFLGRTQRLPSNRPEAQPEFEWAEQPNQPLKQTPLESIHRDQLNARMVPFAGWNMPVYYRGISEEHAAVRQAAGLFDVGHMGVFSIEGPKASEFLDLVTTANASRLGVGRSAYTYLLDATGHTLDDLIIYRLQTEHYLAVVNASNTDKDWAWLNGVNEHRYAIEPNDPWAKVTAVVTLRNLKDDAEADRRRLDLALQGPESRKVLQRLAHDEETKRIIRRMRSFDVRTVNLGGTDLEIARTGYTGEKIGYEIFVHPEAAADLWTNILQTGEDLGVKPAGLGARDSTRTEAGLPLYGHELAGPLDLSPGDAGFGSFVKMYKPFFIGRSGFHSREKSRKSRVVRFRITDDRAPIARQGDPIVDRRGAWIGTVTSSALDVHDNQIGMAHIALRSSEESSALYIYAGVSARRTAAPIAPQDLQEGTRIPVPSNAMVISRFQ